MPGLGAAEIPHGVDEADYPFDTGLVVQTFGNGFDVNLPLLSRAEGINLEGTIVLFRVRAI